MASDDMIGHKMLCKAIVYFFSVISLIVSLLCFRVPNLNETLKVAAEYSERMCLDKQPLTIVCNCLLEYIFNFQTKT